MGLQPVRSVIQVNSLDPETRTDLWNLSLNLITATLEGSNRSASSKLLIKIWTQLWRRPVDELPHVSGDTLFLVKTNFLNAEWNSTYDLVEFISQHFGGDGVASAYNEILERNLCGYRFISGQLAPVFSDMDVAAVEGALEDPDVADVVRHHLERALALLADRADPDYANSVKESISAVEAQLKLITGESPMGRAIDALQAAAPRLHPALARSWKALYGYTSDEDGVRHGSADAPSVDQSTAVYMLVTCSALVSFLRTNFWDTSAPGDDS
jgi:hypothetical protein